MNNLLAAAVLLALPSPLRAGPVEDVRARIQWIQKAIDDDDVADWSAGETSMSFLSDAEKRRRLGGLPHPGGAHPKGTRVSLSRSAPSSLDWRDKDGADYVTPVKDQGSCASCWAFSTTAALESYVLRTQGGAAPLSEQTVLSCSGGGNCENGGYTDTAADYIRDHGSPLETDFPYDGADDKCSPADGAEAHAQRVGRWIHVNQSVNDLKAALLKYGPLSVRMAVFEEFFHYAGGVYRHVDPTQNVPLIGGALDTIVSGLFRKIEGHHFVLLIGYDDADEAFLAKNSWGDGWGEDGYFRIAYTQVDDAVSFGNDAIAFVAPGQGPDVTLTPPDPAPANGGYTLAGSVSPASNLVVQVDGQPWVPVAAAPGAAAGGSDASYPPLLPWGDRLEGDWSLDLGALPDGTHSVAVRARDAQGGVTEESATFAVGAEAAAQEQAQREREAAARERRLEELNQ